MIGVSGCPACGAGLHTEVGQMVREKWRSMLASCCHGSNYVPDKRLGQLLQQWGGDEEEGVGLSEKEGGERERRLKVLGEDLTAEELKEVLQVRNWKPSSRHLVLSSCCSVLNKFYRPALQCVETCQSLSDSMRWTTCAAQSHVVQSLLMLCSGFSMLTFATVAPAVLNLAVLRLTTL